MCVIIVMSSPIYGCKSTKTINIPCKTTNQQVNNDCITKDQCRKLCAKRGGILTYDPCGNKILIKREIKPIVINSKEGFCFNAARIDPADPTKTIKCLNFEEPICINIWLNSLQYGYDCRKYPLINTPNCPVWYCKQTTGLGQCVTIYTYQCVSATCTCVNFWCGTGTSP